MLNESDKYRMSNKISETFLCTYLPDDRNSLNLLWEAFPDKKVIYCTIRNFTDKTTTFDIIGGVCHIYGNCYSVKDTRIVTRAETVETFQILLGDEIDVKSCEDSDVRLCCERRVMNLCKLSVKCNNFINNKDVIDTYVCVAPLRTITMG